MLWEPEGNPAMPKQTITLLVLLLSVSCAMADDDAPQPEQAESVWNATVEHDESRQQEEQTETMRMRVFDDVDRYPADEFPGRERPGIAVDVETVMITCPDGNTRIENVNVGGKDFDIEGECERARAGSKINVEPANSASKADDEAAQ